MRRKLAFWARCLLLLAALGLLTGCPVNNGYKQPVETFQKGVDSSNTVIAGYYKDMNQFERDMYLDGRLYDPKLQLAATDPNHPSPLESQVFSARAIQARLDAISLLGQYGSRLAELAGSEAPAKFESASAALGKNLDQLATTFESLAEGGDAQAKAYAGPVGSLVGVLGRMYMEHQRDKALTVAIKEGAPQVENILNLLKEDLAKAIGPQRLTGWDGAFSERMLYYDANREKLSFAEREKILANINDAAQKYDAAKSFKPDELVDGIRRAHQALVRYANSDRQPANLDQLKAAMDLFSGRVKQIADAYKQLKAS